MGLHILRPMSKGSGRGRKKTVRKKARRSRSKNTAEGDKYHMWGRRRDSLTNNCTLAVYMQFLVAADNKGNAETGQRHSDAPGHPLEKENAMSLRNAR
jgi:hypothetical protein